MKIRVYLLLLVIFGAFGIIAGTRARAWAQSEPVKPQFIDMTRLLRSPHQYNRQAVVFTCRFAKQGELFRQDAKTFTERDHLNFVAWPVEAALWDRTARRNLLSTLYVRKDNREAVAALASLSRYDVVKIAGYVEEVYANMAWINVEKIVPINGENLDDEMLKEIARGDELLKDGKITQAKSAFSSVLSRGAPAFVRQHIDHATADYAPAETIVQKPLENYMPLVEAARHAARNNDLGEAENLYVAARKKSAHNAWLYKEIGLFYEYEFSLNANPKKLEQAFAAYVQAEAISGAPDADLQFLKARVAFAIGKEKQQFGAVEELLARCLQIDPNHSLGRQLSAELTSAKLSLSRDFSALSGSPIEVDSGESTTINEVAIVAPIANDNSLEAETLSAAELIFDRDDLPMAKDFSEFAESAFDTLSPVENFDADALDEISAQTAELKTTAATAVVAAEKHVPIASLNSSIISATELPLIPEVKPMVSREPLDIERLPSSEKEKSENNFGADISSSTPKRLSSLAEQYLTDNDIPEWAR